MNYHTGDEMNADPSGFRSYPVDQAMSIIRSIAEHRWPMTVDEAFSLRDQFGWTPAPDDGEFFVTPVSNGDEDGYIELDVSNNKFVSGVSFRLTTLAPPDPDPDIRALIQSARSGYVAGLTSLYGAATPGPSSEVETFSWYLPSRASVGLGVGTRLVSATIESPAMIDLTDAEKKCFAEGGEL
ncbi:hypothetical protein BKH26_13590 [Actinomyces oris]|nr:hypothetical protein BKH26_13590 [Actinomyces oris]